MIAFMILNEKMTEEKDGKKRATEERKKKDKR